MKQCVTIMDINVIRKATYLYSVKNIADKKFNYNAISGTYVRCGKKTILTVVTKEKWVMIFVINVIFVCVSIRGATCLFTLAKKITKLVFKRFLMDGNEWKQYAWLQSQTKKNISTMDETIIFPVFLLLLSGVSSTVTFIPYCFRMNGEVGFVYAILQHSFYSIQQPTPYLYAIYPGNVGVVR